ncbi:MAG: sulfotransferase family 2 domain-containing protein, partial [Myxococcota bacterium]
MSAPSLSGIGDEATLYFTHVPKTSGTSMVRLAFGHLPDAEVERYGSLKRLAGRRAQPPKLVTGHFPWGAHLALAPRRHAYLTMLRDPIDRVTSMYYFIKNVDRRHFEHPRRALVESTTLEEFAALPQIRNLQSRFVAGYPAMKAGRLVAPRRFDRALAAVAWRQLQSYAFVGFQHRFEASARRLLGELGRELPAGFADAPRAKQTRGRPKVADLSPPTRRALEDANRADLAL